MNSRVTGGTNSESEYLILAPFKKKVIKHSEKNKKNKERTWSNCAYTENPKLCISGKK